MHNNRKQRSVKFLVIYMIMALLFLASVKLHIHTPEGASSADHGSAVSISSLADDFVVKSVDDEINVTPDSVLKMKQDSISIFAVFLLVAITVASLCAAFIGRMRESLTRLPLTPFYGAPSLRAPPQ